MPRPRANAERDAQIVELRRSGVAVREIAAHYNLSECRTRQIIDEAYEQALAPNVAELRRTEGDRLDRLQRKVWAAALQGDVAAVNAVLRIMERRAKLFGLDAPARFEVETVFAHDIEAITAKVRQLRSVPALEQEVEEAELVEEA